MAKHALLSASGAHRWLLCTPSAQLEQKFPASTSAYAEEGTVAHALAELTTRYFLGELDEVSYENQIKSEFEPNSYYNAEMRECAVAYAKFVTGRLAEAKKTCPDAMIILETRLDFSKYVPGGFGTGDCVIIAEPILDVIDFKYGKGHRVEAEDNPQMQLYGLGALEQFGDLYEIKTVRMTIFQPRLSGIEDSSEKTVKELKPIVNSWRAANKSITKFWWDTDAAVRRCITTQAPVDLPHGMRLRKQGPLMRLRLPNGRELSYVKPRVDGDDNITYEGTIQSSGGWGRIESYGPKFVENIVQATARDCLAEAMFRLEAAGFPIVFHVHDEVICEVPIGVSSAEELGALMGQPISWAPNLPLRADAYECEYYRKD